MKILLTRPYENSVSLKHKIESSSKHECVISPLLEIEIYDRKINIPANSNILITSANGIKALAKNTNEKDYNIITVGKTSAKEAEKLGFKKILSATHDKSKESGETALFNFIKENFPAKENFYHISAEITKGRLGLLMEREGYNYIREILYKAHRLELTDEAVKLFRNEINVIFFSERTARIFLEQINVLNLPYGFSRINAVCLSGKIAGVLEGFDFNKVIFPKYPNSDSLLKLIESL